MTGIARTRQAQSTGEDDHEAKAMQPLDPLWPAMPLRIVEQALGLARSSIVWQRFGLPATAATASARRLPGTSDEEIAAALPHELLALGLSAQLTRLVSMMTARRSELLVAAICEALAYGSPLCSGSRLLFSDQSSTRVGVLDSLADNVAHYLCNDGSPQALADVFAAHCPSTHGAPRWFAGISWLVSSGRIEALTRRACEWRFQHPQPPYGHGYSTRGSAFLPYAKRILAGQLGFRQDLI